jgi:hypothetical protein
MYKGTIEITNEGLGFKLINSMSFGEFMISAGYIQKTIKGDLHVRVNNAILPQNQCGKVLEDSRGHYTEAERQRLPCGAGWPHLQAAPPLWALPVSPSLLC